jgi:hypothetical protein
LRLSKKEIEYEPEFSLNVLNTTFLRIIILPALIIAGARQNLQILSVSLTAQKATTPFSLA